MQMEIANSVEHDEGLDCLPIPVSPKIITVTDVGIYFLESFRNNTVLIWYCFLDRQVWANSVDPDQTASKEQSENGLHCLLI